MTSIGWKGRLYVCSQITLSIQIISARHTKWHEFRIRRDLKLSLPRRQQLCPNERVIWSKEWFDWDRVVVVLEGIYFQVSPHSCHFVCLELIFCMEWIDIRLQQCHFPFRQVCSTFCCDVVLVQVLTCARLRAVFVFAALGSVFIFEKVVSA